MSVRNRRREQWFAQFEAALVALDQRFIGRVPWDAAAFHFNSGTSPGLAAFKVSQNEAPAGSKFPAGAVVRRT